MFWFGRYAERAEDLLRLVLAAHALAEDFRDPAALDRRREPRGADGRAAPAGRPAPRPTPTTSTPTSARCCSTAAGPAAVAHGARRAARRAARACATSSRRDIWRAFGATDRAVAGAASAAPHSHQVAESAGRMLTGILSLQGVTASMIRDPGWHVIGAGRALERALQVCHLLAATTTERRGIDVDREVLNAVLAATESAVTHRRRYRGYVRPGRRARAAAAWTPTTRARSPSRSPRPRDHLAALPGVDRLVAPRAAARRPASTTLAARRGRRAWSRSAASSRPNLVRFLDATSGRSSDRLGRRDRRGALRERPGAAAARLARLRRSSREAAS